MIDGGGGGWSATASLSLSLLPLVLKLHLKLLQLRSSTGRVAGCRCSADARQLREEFGYGVYGLPIATAAAASTSAAQGRRWKG